MEDNYTHAIVHFNADNSVEVVPRSWVLPDSAHAYFTPAGTKKLKKLVKDGVPPRPEWIIYDCKIFKWFDSYDNARAKLKDAIVTSDLSGNELGRRVSKKQDFVVALPTYPSDLQNQLRVENFGVEQQLDEDAADLGDLDNFFDDPAPGSNQLQDMSNMNLNPTGVVYHDAIDATFKAQVLSKLEKLTIAIQQQGIMLATILTHLDMKTAEQGKDGSFEFGPGYFPLKRPEQLASLNEQLQHAPAKNKLIQILRGCGGATVDDAMKLMIGQLMDDDLAATHSSKGKGGKSAFGQYTNICEAIIGGLSGNPRTKPNATVADFNSVLPKTLKKAADRVRLRRKMLTNQIPPGQHEQVGRASLHDDQEEHD